MLYYKYNKEQSPKTTEVIAQAPIYYFSETLLPRDDRGLWVEGEALYKFVVPCCDCIPDEGRFGLGLRVEGGEICT